MQKSLISNKFTILQILILGALAFSLFQPAVKNMISRWSGDYGYGYLIPFVAAYLIFEKRNVLMAQGNKTTWAGVYILFAGLLLFWMGELSGEYFSLYFASWIALVGIIWFYLGWEKIKILMFPLLILPTMFRLPEFIHRQLTFKLKLISSEIGVWMLHFYGMSAFREGNLIDLGFTQLQVVDACSGLRYLYPLFIMGLLLAYFFNSFFWKKVLLVLSTIPLTIITNSLRIALTGILYEIWGSEVAEGFFHGFSGWFIFVFGLGVLMLEMWAMNRFRSLFGSKKALLAESKVQGTRLTAQGGTTEKESEPGSLDARKLESEKMNLSQSDTLQTCKLNPQNTIDLEALSMSRETAEKKGFAAFFHPPHFVVAVILLGLTLVLSQGLEFREKIPIAKSFDKFPLKVAGWSGIRESMEKKFIDALDLNDYVIVDYADQKDRWVNFYTAYYESQRKGESIHSPATCLPGNGWEFQQAGEATIPVQYIGSASMPVNRAYMVKGENRQLSYYWFPQRDRILTNAYQLKLYNFWDALIRKRTDGALVRLITPVYDGEEVVDAEERLIAFTREIVPVLNEFLPK